MTGGIIIWAVALVLLVLIGLAWVLGSRAKARLVAKYPPPGQMVDVGGYRMHIHLHGPNAGDGRPTVVLESGDGEPGLSWGRIPQEVAKFAPVCAYDRAGLGWSESSPWPRTLANIVEELRTLLGRAGVSPPYVLVGHSMGGLYMQYFAHRHPEEVAGMVLVDSAHKDQDILAPETLTKLTRRGQRFKMLFFGFLRALNSVGLLALAPGWVSRMWFGQIPAEVRETYIGVICSNTRWLRAVGQEAAYTWENLAAAKAARTTPLGGLPLEVLSAGQSLVAPGPGLSEEVVEQFQAAHDEMQDELTRLSSRGKRVIVEDSGHYMHVDRPEVVVDAIREVVEAVRESSSVDAQES
jgi:pimeloyl-ACP methyl ester carboxylesterase